MRGRLIETFSEATLEYFKGRGTWNKNAINWKIAQVSHQTFFSADLFVALQAAKILLTRFERLQKNCLPTEEPNFDQSGGENWRANHNFD